MPHPRLRAAIIGCGRISRPHARSYRQVAATELVAAADVNPVAGAAFAAEFGLERVYVDVDEMLARERPDIVSICAWPPLHAALTEAACRAGVRAILCEKPIAATLADADRMLAAARAAGVLLCVNHQRRFAGRYRRARQVIARGAIGQVRRVVGSCGGDLLTDGTHLIDLTRFLLGDPALAWVFGAVDQRRRPNAGPDGYGMSEYPSSGKRYGNLIERGTLALVQVADGPRAILEVGNVAPPGCYQRFVIDGDEGRIEISGDDPSADEPELRVWRRRGRSLTAPRCLPEGVDGLQQPMADAIAALVVCLRRGGEHPLRADSARAALEAIMAIFASARDRQVIELPFSEPDSPLDDLLASEAPARLEERAL
jgi:predicted dehydrogenase